MGIIKKENVADFNAPRNINTNTFAEICICLGEQIAYLEEGKRQKSFAHEWNIDVELLKLAKMLYDEWTNNKDITEKYISEFVINRVHNMQLAHEAELNKMQNEIINNYLTKNGIKVEKGRKIRLNISEVWNTCDKIVSNDTLVYNGFGWEEIGY